MWIVRRLLETRSFIVHLKHKVLFPSIRLTNTEILLPFHCCRMQIHLRFWSCCPAGLLYRTIWSVCCSSRLPYPSQGFHNGTYACSLVFSILSRIFIYLVSSMFVQINGLLSISIYNPLERRATPLILLLYQLDTLVVCLDFWLADDCRPTIFRQPMTSTITWYAQWKRSLRRLLEWG
jgi:hypothetical protein